MLTLHSPPPERFPDWKYAWSLRIAFSPAAGGGQSRTSSGSTAMIAPLRRRFRFRFPLRRSLLLSFPAPPAVPRLAPRFSSEGRRRAGSWGSCRYRSGAGGQRARGGGCLRGSGCGGNSRRGFGEQSSPVLWPGARVGLFPASRS